MKPQLIELFGIDKLNESTRNTAQSAFSKLLIETGDPDESPYMREFLGSLGVHRLPDELQNDIREKAAVIVELERNGKKISAKDFKWNNFSSNPQPINEVKKSDFHWHTYRQVKTAGSTEKIRKDQFRWSQKDAYGSATEGI